MNRFRLGAPAFALLTALGVFSFTGGCSSTAKANADEACDTYFDATLTDRCTGGAVSAERRGQMRTRFRDVCKKGLAAPATGLTAEYFVACGNALAALPCGENALPKQCSLPSGSLADGTVCNDSAQCKSSHCDSGQASRHLQWVNGPWTPSADCGVCAAASSFAAGPAKAPSPLGAPCGENIDCQQPELACLRDVDGKRTCTARVGEGAACGLQGECLPPFRCFGGAPSSGSTCVRWPAAAKPGEPCGVIAGESGAVAIVGCDTGSCSNPDPTGKGTCATLIPDGQPCAPESVPPQSAVCDLFSECLSGICRMTAPATCGK